MKTIRKILAEFSSFVAIVICCVFSLKCLNDGTASASVSNGAGVYLVKGSFSLGSDAIIKGNIASSSSQEVVSGGGILNESGTLYINGGSIIDNSAINNYNPTNSEFYGSYTSAAGGGVYNDNIMRVIYGAIQSNMVQSNGFSYGGGIANGEQAQITMSGSTIDSNVVEGAAAYGGGIYNRGELIADEVFFNANVLLGSVYNSGAGICVDEGIFTMEYGEITSNWIGGDGDCYGGGVAIENGGSFIMNDGVITDNRNENGDGGGVYIGYLSSFTMKGGTIADNTASRGAAIYIDTTGGAEFIYEGGQIDGEIYFNPNRTPIVLSKAPENQWTMRFSTISVGAKVMKLEGISTVDTSLFNVTNLPSSYRLVVQNGYVVIASNANYDVSFSCLPSGGGYITDSAGSTISSVSVLGGSQISYNMVDKTITIGDKTFNIKSNKLMSSALITVDTSYVARSVDYSSSIVNGAMTITIKFDCPIYIDASISQATIRYEIDGGLVSQSTSALSILATYNQSVTISSNTINVPMVDPEKGDYSDRVVTFQPMVLVGTTRYYFQNFVEVGSWSTTKISSFTVKNGVHVRANYSTSLPSTFIEYGDIDRQTYPLEKTLLATSQNYYIRRKYGK